MALTRLQRRFTGLQPKQLDRSRTSFDSISGLQQIMDVPGGVKFNDTDITALDSATGQTGRHVWKFGFIFQRYGTSYGFVNDYGTFNFDGSVTGNAYADFLLGIPQSSARTNPLPDRHQYVSNWAFTLKTISR